MAEAVSGVNTLHQMLILQGFALPIHRIETPLRGKLANATNTQAPAWSLTTIVYLIDVHADPGRKDTHPNVGLGLTLRCDGRPFVNGLEIVLMTGELTHRGHQVSACLAIDIAHHFIEVCLVKRNRVLFIITSLETAYNSV